MTDDDFAIIERCQRTKHPGRLPFQLMHDVYVLIMNAQMLKLIIRHPLNHIYYIKAKQPFIHTLRPLRIGNDLLY